MAATMRTYAVLLVALLPAGLAASGQVVKSSDARAVLREEVLKVTRSSDASVRLRTVKRRAGRVDAAGGVTRALYEIRDRVRASSAEGAARAFLSRHYAEFGWRPLLEDLRLVDVRKTGVSTHLLFEQTYRGVVVHRRYVKVNLDRDLQPGSVFSGYAPRMSGATLSVTPSISSQSAAAGVRGLARVPVRVGTPKLVVVPEPEARLAWRVTFWPEDRPGEWEALIDAHSGEELQVLSLAISRRPPSEGTSASPTASSETRSMSGSGFETGSGLVFDPDPLTTADVIYGSPYVDDGDASSSYLAAEQIPVDLPGISLGSDNLYRLEGPYVRIVTADPSQRPTPQEASADGFRYDRSQPEFESVMAYYHVDKSQRYVQGLGFSGIRSDGVSVDARASSQDNSYYIPSQNLIQFGTGGVDDAEDAGVVWHEYAHALLESSARDLIANAEGRALHEGWSDYWATSYMRSLFEGGLAPRADWQNLFHWDSGDGTIWPGRTVGGIPGRTYPDDTDCDDVDAGRASTCDIYEDGRLWATAVMEIHDGLGREMTDRLNLQSHSYLSYPVTFMDAAEALILADRDLYQSAHTEFLIATLSTRGLVDKAPAITHEPLRSTEQLGGTVAVTADVYEVGDPIQSVRLVHRRDDGAFESLEMSHVTGPTYETQLPLPDAFAAISYYIEAVDDGGRQSRLPRDAPAEVFAFRAGPDSRPPVVLHDPIVSASPVLWPVAVTASASDDLGVGHVRVEYEVLDPASAVVSGATFFLAELEPGKYSATFPLELGDVPPGSTLRYRVVAQDASASKNEVASPEVGMHEFPIVTEGLLASLNFDVAAGEEADGVWERGAPSDVVPHSGEAVWGTVLGGPYPAEAQLSSLILPEFRNLDVLDQAYLVFWHWHELEHDGTLEPGRPPAGKIYDGANVKLSSDSGSWVLTAPESGYTGIIEFSQWNPLSQQPAFGGQSYGWRREVIALPRHASVRVRFDLGTDNNNTAGSGFRGWFIDDVSVVTSVPADVEPPAVLELPDPFVTRSLGMVLPSVTVRATDDTGVSEVRAEYSINGTPEGYIRLGTRGDEEFSGTFPSDVALSAGDRLQYRFHVLDFAGNEIVTPSASEEPLIVEYRLEQSSSVLAGVQATGQWDTSGNVWYVSPQDRPDARSSLLAVPLFLPVNAANLSLQLTHEYELGDGVGGNVKLSPDGGSTWRLLEPDGSYPAVMTASSSHPMNGERVFAGSSDGEVVMSYDLSTYAGRQVQIRLDFGADRAMNDGERWAIRHLTLEVSTTDDEVETPIELALNPNYPDPFSTTTTVHYSLPEQMIVKLELFDVLGRLVSVIAYQRDEPGTHTLTVDGSDLAAGVYFLRMEAGDKRKVERMVIVR